MPAHVLALVFPLVVSGLCVFLAYRIQLFKERSEGRYLFVSGGILLLLVSVWNALATSSTYSTWFVITAYPWISFGEMLVLMLGLSLTVMGIVLHAQRQLARQEEIELREGKLSVLENLQHDARGPYQLLELLNLTLRETLLQFPESCGAVFLVNRSQRMLVLGAVSGFSKNETVCLEHFPLGNNLVSRAIEVGEPALASYLELQDKDGKRVESRFQSVLVLPLCSGMEKIGAILLASEPAKAFAPVDIKYLGPISEWLAEKIRTARLTREIAVLKGELEGNTAHASATARRFTATSKALSSDEAVEGFCHALVGIAGSNSVQLFGLRNGTILHLGGSEPVGQLSESFRTALIDALDRRKPVVINHESTDSSGQTAIARSSLVFTLPGRSTIEALMLVRESSPISVSEEDLKLLSSLAVLAGVALDRQDGIRRDLTRRLGIDKVLELLTAKPTPPGESASMTFLKLLSDLLPKTSSAVAFDRMEDGTLRPSGGHGVETPLLNDLQISGGEGIVGETVSNRQGRSVYGKREVLAEIEKFDTENQQILQRLFGERRLPIFLATVPLLKADALCGVAVFFQFDMLDADRLEWDRLLQLGAGLYSLRLTLDHFQQQQETQSSAALGAPQAYAVNELNNHLSAVIGNAELMAQKEEISGEIRSQLKGIIAEAERAAGIVRESLAAKTSNVPAPGGVMTLDSIVDRVLSEARISGDLYMAGGRPREIHVALKGGTEISLPPENIRSFFETALARFAATVADDDNLTISTYRRDDHVYLDVSRHHKNFPSVEPVAGFGEYQFAETAFDSHPSDIHLKSLVGTASAYAVDRVGTPPAYLSFRFPTKSTTRPVTAANSPTIRILAIDDQPVILDLISAMCQSMGYGATTASTAEAGVRLALSQKFDVILTDLAMPDMSGLEVARQIRRVQPHTPIILVTGWEAGIDSSQMKSAGITEVLYKPFRIEQLTDIIRFRATSLS